MTESTDLARPSLSRRSAAPSRHVRCTFGAFLLCATVALSGCTGSDDSTGDSQSVASTSTTASVPVTDASDGGEEEGGAEESGADAGPVITVDVNVVELRYEPQNVVIASGDTVRWTNQDSFGHTVTSTGDEVFGGGLDAAGAVFEHTFSTAGTFSYVCNIHPDMTGQISVNA